MGYSRPGGLRQATPTLVSNDGRIFDGVFSCESVIFREHQGKVAPGGVTPLPGDARGSRWEQNRLERRQGDPCCAESEEQNARHLPTRTEASEGNKSGEVPGVLRVHTERTQESFRRGDQGNNGTEESYKKVTKM